MNFCQRCRAQLADFLDGMLSASAREQVAAHLEICAACAGEKRELEITRRALRELESRPAPENLRLRVRNTLQNEAQARQKQRERPIWALGNLQKFAWTGTLAFAALALMVLARPFSNAPLPLPLPESQIAPETPAAAPVPLRNRAPQSVLSKKPRKPVLTPKIAQSADQSAAQSVVAPLVPTPRENDSPIRAAPRLETPPRSRLSAKIEDGPQELSAPRPLPIAKAPAPRAAVAVPVTPKNPVAPAPKPASAMAASPSIASQSIASQLQSREKTQEIGAPSFAITLSPLGNPVETQNFVASSGRISALEPRRASATAPENEATQSSPGAAPQVAAPAPMMRKSRAADETQSAGAVASADRDNRGAASETQPMAPSPVLRGGNAISNATPQEATRRFQLQIQPSRAVLNSQIRVELPPGLQFFASGATKSQVVWSGNLGSEKPTEIEFELQSSRGGEKIVVRVEQKGAIAASKPLETQTLVLPASSR